MPIAAVPGPTAAWLTVLIRHACRAATVARLRRQRATPSQRRRVAVAENFQGAMQPRRCRPLGGLAWRCGGGIVPGIAACRVLEARQPIETARRQDDG